VNRREFIGRMAAGLTVGNVGRFPLPASDDSQQLSKFRYRGYLGWITDLATKPNAHAMWPSMNLDAELLEDYRRTFALMKRLGFDAAVIWGFYVSRAWPVDITNAVTKRRGAMVERLITLAHAYGLRVYTGLGVYSWGFEEIIRANPKLARTNPKAMCGSLPEAWEWMRKVTDFALTRFPVDGVSLQSADQGRCECEECRRYGDTEYHARLDVRVGEYIRSRWPEKTVGVSGWGMDLGDSESLPHLVNLSRYIDYLIDVPDSARRQDPTYRRKLIKALQCGFGTIGGPQVEPPQHWSRDRWFLPTVKSQGEHLAELRADGGSACEYFFHILANPGDEVSFHVAGKLLSEPNIAWHRHLQTTIEELYGTRATLTGDLMSLFIGAEEAYLKNFPAMRSGTIAMEPLFGDRPGPPVYVTKRFSPEQRKEYRRDLERIEASFLKIAPDVPEKNRVQTIIRCLQNTKKDLDSVSQ
jgi:hypothetical protein